MLQKDVCNLRDAHLIRAAGLLPASSLVQDSLPPGQAFWARRRGLRNPPSALCCFPVPQARGASAERRPRLRGMSLPVFACRLGLGILLWLVAEPFVSGRWLARAAPPKKRTARLRRRTATNAASCVPSALKVDAGAVHLQWSHKPGACMLRAVESRRSVRACGLTRYA